MQYWFHSFTGSPPTLSAQDLSSFNPYHPPHHPTPNAKHIRPTPIYLPTFHDHNNTQQQSSDRGRKYNNHQRSPLFRFVRLLCSLFYIFFLLLPAWHSSKIQQDHARRERDISYQLRSRPSVRQRRLQRSTATRVTRARFTHTRHNSASLICTKSGKYLIVVPGHRRRMSLGAYRDYKPALPRALPAFPLIILGSILQYHDDARGVRLRTR